MQNLDYNQSRISLCLTYPRLNEPDKNAKFRIADLINGELFPVNFFAGDMETKMIYAKSNDTIAFRAELVEWWYENEDYMKTRSLPINSNNIYEIYKNNDYLNNWDGNENLLISDLKKGIVVSEGLTESFFLLYGENDVYYKAVLLEKKNITNNTYKININIENVNNNITKINSYYIRKNDIIDTSTSNIRLTATSFVERLFYGKLLLPDRRSDINPWQIEDYLPYLLKRFIRNNKSKFNLTNNNIRDISFFITEFIKDQNELESLSKYTSISYKDVENKLYEVSESIMNFIIGNDFYDATIEHILINNDGFYKEIKETVKNELINSADNELLILKETLIKQQNMVTNLENDYKVLSNDYIAKNIKLETAKNELINIKALKKTIEKEISEITASYKDNVIRIIGDNEIFKLMGNYSKNKDTFETLNIKTIEEVSKNPTVTDELDYLIDDLAENLRVIGIDGKMVNHISKYILSLIALKVPLVLPHCIAKDLANSISALIDNTIVTEINLVKSEIILNINSEINNVQRNVIYLNNFIEDLEDRVISEICTLENKIIIMPYKDDLSVKTLSNFVFSKFAILNFDQFISIPSGEEFAFGKVTSEIISASTNYSKVEKYFHELKSSYQIHSVRNSFLLKHAKIMDQFISIGGDRNCEEVLFNEFELIIPQNESIQNNRSNTIDGIEIGD